ncbi:MAG TPA: FCD domain-containing protein [Anaeromyxobacter sp.]|nr:FCD domain-containing protein [Anaeromyxobacter sp.]
MTSLKHGISLPSSPAGTASPFESVALGLSERRSAVETVIDTIEHLILTKRLRPGDRIPSEVELTRTLSTSRGSIREAIKILSSFGVLEIRRGDGTYVSESLSRRLFDHLVFQMILSDPDKRMLKELRELIEIGIVKLVLANAGEEDIAVIERELERMAAMVAQKQWDPHTLTQLDLAFHRAVGKATKNELIQRIYDFTLDLFAPSIEETHRNERKGLNALRSHRRIMKGLQARDEAATVAAVRESIEQWAILS